MQLKSLVLASVDALPRHLPELDDFQPDLLMVFTSPSKSVCNKLYTHLKDVTPNLVGCTTAGEISHKQVLTNHIVISALKFSLGSRVVVHTHSLTTVEESYDCGAKLGEKPALATYKHYLGDYASTLPASGLHFPFEVLGPKRQATDLIRTILNVDENDGSLVLGGEVLDEQYVRLMHASTDDLIDDASTAIKKATDGEAFPPLDNGGEYFSLVVSCVGRRLVMGDRVQEEIEELHCHLPDNIKLTGFYSYGELCPFDNHSGCQLHNQTLSVKLLWESDH